MATLSPTSSLCVCGSRRAYVNCCGSGAPHAEAVFSEYAEAIGLHQRGQVEAAVRQYERLLSEVPDHPGALYFLGAAMLEAGKAQDALPRLQRALELQPERDANAWFALGLSAHMTGNFESAVTAYRESLRRDPTQNEVRNNLAIVLRRLGLVDEAARELETAGQTGSMTSAQAMNLANLLVDQGREQEALEHYRRLLAERPDDLAIANNFGGLLVRLRYVSEGMTLLDRAEAQFKMYGTELYFNRGRGFVGQNRQDDAVSAFRKALEFDPRNFRAYAAWASLEEQRHQLDLAAELAGKALGIAPGHPENLLTIVILSKFHRRQKQSPRALELLRGFDPKQGLVGARSAYYFELGTVLDELGHYDEAFAAFSEGNRNSLSAYQATYNVEQQQALAAKLIDFFSPGRIQAMSQLAPATKPDSPRPIFVVGFPRSGTTLVEQIISAHSAITAGDELPYLTEITGRAAKDLRTELPYPECLAETARPENHSMLEEFRTYYLKRAASAGLPAAGGRLFTDKMPLNEWNLGLIRLLFANNPVIHVVRHPLDSCLSSYFKDLTHGGYCSYRLETVAQHYLLSYQIAEHARQNLDMRFLRIRYEDVVNDLETHVRTLLDFIGVPFEEQCLAFHENKRVARTASYAQVTQKLYTTSKYRYRNYRKHIEPMLPILAPVIAELGYDVED